MKARVLFAFILSTLFLDICGARAATVAKFAIGHSTINPRLAPLWIALENLLKALLESLAYIFEPKNKSKVLELIMRRLKITDVGPAEDGYRHLLNTMSRKPYSGVDGLRNVQRLMKVQSPKIGEVKIEDLVDSRLIRKLAESGFIDGLFTTQPTR